MKIIDYIFKMLVIVLIIILFWQVNKVSTKCDKVFQAFSMQTDINTNYIEIIEDLQNQINSNSNRLNAVHTECISKILEGTELQIAVNTEIIKEVEILQSKINSK